MQKNLSCYAIAAGWICDRSKIYPVAFGSVMNIKLTLSNAGWGMFTIGVLIMFSACSAPMDLYEVEAGYMYDHSMVTEKTMVYNIGNTMAIIGAIFIGKKRA